MKTTTTKLTIATALLAVAAGAASSETLSADIPFAFRVGNQAMPAGTYRVQVTGASNNVVTVKSLTSQDQAIVLPTGLSDASKEWKANSEPVLSFECGAGRCALSRIWTGASAPAYNIAHPKLAAGEQASVTLIHMARANGD